MWFLFKRYNFKFKSLVWGEGFLFSVNLLFTKSILGAINIFCKPTSEWKYFLFIVVFFMLRYIGDFWILGAWLRMFWNCAPSLLRSLNRCCIVSKFALLVGFPLCVLLNLHMSMGRNDAMNKLLNLKLIHHCEGEDSAVFPWLFDENNGAHIICFIFFSCLAFIFERCYQYQCMF